MAMVLLVAFLLVLSVASVTGWTVDSRDGADWTPTDGGRRCPRGP